MLPCQLRLGLTMMTTIQLHFRYRVVTKSLMRPYYHVQVLHTSLVLEGVPPMISFAVPRACIFRLCTWLLKPLLHNESVSSSAHLGQQPVRHRGRRPADR